MMLTRDPADAWLPAGGDCDETTAVASEIALPPLAYETSPTVSPT
jgi:hypothetical protein